jgi:hypothetical protein
MKTIKLTDLPKLPSQDFDYRKSVRWLLHPGFVRIRDHCEFLVKDQTDQTTFDLLGWTDQGDIFQGNREGQIAVMGEATNGDGKMWQHVPIFPEYRDEAVFFISELQPTSK